MTRKLIAVATALGAVVLFTATAADAAKKPKNYIDNDGSGTWTSGDVDLAPYLKDGQFHIGEVASTGRGVGDDVVIGDATLYELTTTGDLTITGRLGTRGDGAGPVVKADGSVTIAHGARGRG